MWRYLAMLCMLLVLLAAPANASIMHGGGVRARLVKSVEGMRMRGPHEEPPKANAAVDPERPPPRAF